MILSCGLLVLVLLLVLHRFVEPATAEQRSVPALAPPQEGKDARLRCRLPRAAVLANLATRGLQLAKGELKAVDTFCSAGSMASVVVPDYTGAPVIKLLNGIARGDDINERNGRLR